MAQLLTARAYPGDLAGSGRGRGRPLIPMRESPGFWQRFSIAAGSHWWLDQFQDDAVFGLVAALTVVADDLDDLVEQGRVLAGPGATDPVLDVRTVRWMAGEQKLPQPL